MAKYHASGAILARNSDLDGLTGLYHPSGAIRTTVNTGPSAYDGSGALRIRPRASTPTAVGVHSEDGRLNVRLVDGTTNVGLYAPNGSINMFWEA